MNRFRIVEMCFKKISDRSLCLSLLIYSLCATSDAFSAKRLRIIKIGNMIKVTIGQSNIKNYVEEYLKFTYLIV